MDGARGDACATEIALSPRDREGAGEVRAGHRRRLAPRRATAMCLQLIDK